MFNRISSSFNSFFSKKGAVATVLLFVALPVIIFAAWLTHIVVSIKAGFWILLIAGALLFPIGVIHGIGYWLGAFP